MEKDQTPFYTDLWDKKLEVLRMLQEKPISTWYLHIQDLKALQQ